MSCVSHATTAAYPSSKQLMVPLLELISEGRRRAAEVYDRLAEEFNLSPLLRDKVVLEDHNYWHRRVRWVYQDLKRLGFIRRDTDQFAAWEVTEEGKRFLLNAKPGICISVFATPNGESVWAEAQAGLTHIADESVQLLFASPPFPLHRPREYGNLTLDSYVDWLVDIVEMAKRVMKNDGSVVLDLGNIYERGSPTMSFYQEELVTRLCKEHGWHRPQKLYWENVTKLPTPLKYVARERIRLKDATNDLLWLSKTPRPYADNRAVLNPYSDTHKRQMTRYADMERKLRPSGHDVSCRIYQDNGGSIPGNVIRCAYGADDMAYVQDCKSLGLPPHPARFPFVLPSFLIRFLSRPGDLVLDFFSGSATTGQAAERLGRQWLAIEKSFAYIKTSLVRFGEVSVNPMFKWST